MPVIDYAHTQFALDNPTTSFLTLQPQGHCIQITCQGLCLHWLWYWQLRLFPFLEFGHDHIPLL